MAEEADYEMVMPFLVVKSKGGPYEDVDFTAGWVLGALDQKLETFVVDPSAEYRIKVTVQTQCLPQVDLIAMKHGFVVEKDVSEYPEWTFVTLVRSPWTTSGP